MVYELNPRLKIRLLHPFVKSMNYTFVSCTLCIFLPIKSSAFQHENRFFLSLFVSPEGKFCISVSCAFTRLRSTFIFLIRISLSKTRNVMVWCSPEIQIFLVIYHSYSLLSIYFLLEQFPLTIGREAVLYKTQHQVRSRTRSIIICLVRLSSISVGGKIGS